MRVLFDLRMSNWTGVGRYSRNLVRHLVLAEPGGLEVHALVCRGVDASRVVGDLPDGSLVVRETTIAPFSLRQMGGVGLACYRGVDVVHIPHFTAPWVRGPRRLIVTVHDLIPLHYRTTTGPRRAVFGAWVRRAVQVSNLVVCVSEVVARQLVDELGADPLKLRVIHEAPDPFFVGDHPSSPIPGLVDVPFVLAFANFRHHKGIDVLLRAAGRMPPEIKIVLVGKEPTTGTTGATGTGALAASLVTAGRLVFAGRVTDSELKWLYEHCLAFVHPSREEGFGLPPLEAMACRAPVVSSDIEVSREVLGDAPVYYAPEDAEGLAYALERITRDEGFRRELAARSEARASQFSWEKTARQTIQCYREVCSFEGRSGRSAT